MHFFIKDSPLISACLEIDPPSDLANPSEAHRDAMVHRSFQERAQMAVKVDALAW
jgi:hypothetical protein